MIRRTVRDVPLVVLALLLSAYGIAMVYSAGVTDPSVRTAAASVWKQQLVWFGLGLTAAFVVSRL